MFQWQVYKVSYQLFVKKNIFFLIENCYISCKINKKIFYKLPAEEIEQVCLMCTTNVINSKENTKLFLPYLQSWRAILNRVANYITSYYSETQFVCIGFYIAMWKMEVKLLLLTCNKFFVTYYNFLKRITIFGNALQYLVMCYNIW